MKNYPLLIIVSIIVIALFKYFIYFPLGFDGAYNLEIPKNLYISGKYATNISPFDTFITTGYPVLLPISLSFGLFGMGLLQAKIIMFIFFILFVITLFFILNNYVKDKLIVSLSTFLTIVTFFGFVPGSMHLIFEVIGELPSLTLFLLSLLSFLCGYKNEKQSKKWIYFALAGFLLGLAVETKIIIAVGLVSYLITFLFLFFFDKERIVIAKNIMIFFLAFMIPFVIFRIYQITQMGLASFITNQKDFLIFLKNNGSGLNQVTTYPELLKQHINIINSDMGINSIILIIIFLFVASTLIHSVYKKRYLLTNLSIFIILFSIWWFFINISLWTRHYVLAIITIIILLSIALSQALNYLKVKFINNGSIHKLISVIIVFFIAAFIIQTRIDSLKDVFNINHYKNQLDQQTSMGQFINKNLNEKDIYYRGWWQAPEISFMAEKSFINLNNNNYIDSDPAYLILTDLQYRLDNKSYWEDFGMCSNNIIFQDNNNIICEIKNKRTINNNPVNKSF